MPEVQVRGATIHYEVAGAGGEPVLFAHGLLFSSRIFDDQVRALQQDYRCIAFDFRGQGRSEVTESGYDIDALTDDTAALVETLDARSCHFVGLSMGGFVGLRLAIRRPELLRSLVLLDTTADVEGRWDRTRYQALALVARFLGFRPVVGRILRIMFGPRFLRDGASRSRWRDELLRNDRVGAVRAVEGVLRRQSVASELGRIATPALIVVGEQDHPTPPDHSRRMQAAIEGARLVVIPQCGHMSSIEAPEAVTGTIRGFLQETRGTAGP